MSQRPAILLFVPIWRQPAAVLNAKHKCIQIIYQIMGDSPKDPCDFKCEHLQLIQKNIDKYDEMGGKIRNWTITLWSGTLIAGLIQKIGGRDLWILIGISIAIPLIMGIYDEIFKTYREGYKKTRDELINKIKGKPYDENYIYFPKQKEGEELILYSIKSFIDVSKVHVNLVYWLLVIASILIAVAKHF